VPYSEIEDVEIGGPGLIKTGGGFVGGGFGLQGAAEDMPIAAVLNALTTRTSIKTIMRIQGTSCELFLLDTKATPSNSDRLVPPGGSNQSRPSGCSCRDEPAANDCHTPVQWRS
jgi:hypothetical protein